MKREKRLREWKVVLGIGALVLSAGFGHQASAKEREGARVLVVRTNGPSVKGELLAVRNEQIVLLDTDSLNKVFIESQRVERVTIIKRSRVFSGMGYGLLIGGGTGALIGFLSGDDKSGWFRFTAGEKALAGGLALGLIGVPVGGLWGASRGIDETVVFTGRTDHEIGQILKILDRLSRFPGDTPLGLQSPQPVKNSLKEGSRAMSILQRGMFSTKRHQAEPASVTRSSRAHLTLEPGYFSSKGIGGFSDYFEDLGFGDDVEEGGWFSSGYVHYPNVHKNPAIYLKTVRIEYSVTPNLALGLTYSPLGKHQVRGHRSIQEYGSSTYLSVNFEGNSAFLSVAYLKVPDTFLRKSCLKAGIGFGLNFTRLDFNSHAYSWLEVGEDRISFSKKGLALMAFGEYDYYFSRRWSVGFSVDYKLVPVVVDAFQMDCPYVGYESGVGRFDSVISVDFPEQRMNLGGFGFGINIGIHF